MPSFGRSGTKGDLFIEYSVVLPVDLSPELRRSESYLPLVPPESIGFVSNCYRNNFGGRLLLAKFFLSPIC